MTTMTEVTENPVLSAAPEPDVEPKESKASEETDGRGNPEQEDGQQAEERQKDTQRNGERDKQRDGEEDGQQDTQRDGEEDRQQDTQRDGEEDRQQGTERDGEEDGQQDTQRDGEEDGQQDTQRDGEEDRQQDTQTDGGEDGQQADETYGQPNGKQNGQTGRPPAAESSIKESKWVMGAQCRAVWSEDGRVYPATVLSVDGERCRVFFNGYGNQEDVDLSALTSPVAAVPQPQAQTSQDWRPGSVCRAVFSEDSLVYPAVVLWVKGQRCRVRFDDYNNEEEKDVSSLLRLDELHGSVKAVSAEGKEKPSNQGHTETEAEEKKRGNQAEKTTNHSSSFFPPFPPPPPQTGSGDSVSFVPPPPPPLWQFGSAAAVDSSSSSMLMLWYMCGFHTGSYLAQQGFKSNSKE
ncbi:uncharacterized protein AB9W97_016318 isoform 2-T3 [Spinachia spinachia]